MDEQSPKEKRKKDLKLHSADNFKTASEKNVKYKTEADGIETGSKSMKKILSYDLPGNTDFENVLILEENDDLTYPIWITLRTTDFEACETPEERLEEMKRAEEDAAHMLLSIDDLRDMGKNILAFADLVEKTIHSDRRDFNFDHH